MEDFPRAGMVSVYLFAGKLQQRKHEQEQQICGLISRTHLMLFIIRAYILDYYNILSKVLVAQRGMLWLNQYQISEYFFKDFCKIRFLTYYDI